jgi:DNA mismatch endonuclease (patch repair protein)
MVSNRGRDSAPELALRRELHRRGRRFRVQRRPEPGLRCTADILFARARVVVFVDGCFWHRCPEHGTDPVRNGSWWAAKLDANVARDRRNDAALAAAGWKVVRIWEHECVNEAADRVERAIDAERSVK